MKNKIYFILISVSLIISIGIIGALLAALSISEKRLENIGDLMEEMETQNIITDVSVNQ